MILIADSGATKTDWSFGTELSSQKLIHTEGINPFHMNTQYIEEIISRQLIPQLPSSASSDCTAIYFYGAGCTPERAKEISDPLHHIFPHAHIEAASDLLGAARALCQRTAGIACILGTGSNSCLYDGTNIVENISPLGYILGDEGSGAYLGKHFLSDCLKRQLPVSLTEDFLERYNLTLPDILEKVYRQPQANRFLASLTPYIYEHREMPEIRKLLTDSFTAFLKRNVLLYEKKDPVSFTGSVAWYFQEEIRSCLSELRLTTGRFVKNPIEELAVYHFSMQNVS